LLLVVLTGLRLGDYIHGSQSEFISIRNAPHVVASCFKHPFSHQETVTCDDAEEPKRNIILVGHDVGADIAFLRTVGYDVHNLSTLQEVADTSTMWKYLKRESNARSLGSILAELGIEGWNLHNAGNDAVYTLQAMLGIAIKHMDERQKSREIKNHEKYLRIQE
jgi:DNA polymerase III alpha subunit (gram-positive type)